MSSKQPSRKGKKAWRKNVDITPVTKGLEEVREQIIQGGVIAEKTDDALFSLDLTGSNQIAKRENLTKKLKLDEILTTRSAVPAVSSKKRPSDSLGSGIYTKKKHRKDGVSHAHLQRLRALAYGKSTPDVKKSDAPSYDPWDDNAVAEIKPKGQVAAAGQAPVKVKEGVRTDFLEFKPPPKPPVTLKHEPVSLSANVKMPAVRLPDAGISYNPEFEKWEKLLREEGEKEVEREKERLRIAAEEERIQRLRDMSDEEPAEESESESESESEEEDGENADGEALEVKEKKKVEARRKTTAQRNREAKQKAEQKAREEKRREKIMERELTLIKKYAKDVKAQERLRMARKMEEMARKVDDDRNPKVMRKKKFGKIPLPQAPLELQLPDELAESLRTLKPEGNLLQDRFRSLRERGIVETRGPIIEAKKKKVTTTEKWSYKDFK